MSTGDGRAAPSQTLERGLQVLDLLGERGAAGLTMTELAGELQVGRAVVYRLVATLGDRKLVIRGTDGRVRLGPGVTRWAHARMPLLRDAAVPVLRVLADRVGATAHLTVVDGGEALAVAVVEPSWTDFHVSYRVGARHPLERGAAGRAILAGRRPGSGAAFVTSAGELQDGAHGLAAPLPNPCSVEGSVGVVSLTPLDDATVGPIVLAAAAEVAGRL